MRSEPIKLDYVKAKDHPQKGEAHQSTALNTFFNLIIPCGLPQGSSLDNEGNITAILIGSKVEEILDKEGKEIKVKGLLKPKMRVKNKEVSVIEIREIDFVTEE